MACPQGHLGCSPRPHRTLVTQSPMAQGQELPEDPAVPERGPSGRHLPGEVGPLFSTTGFAKSPPAPSASSGRRIHNSGGSVPSPTSVGPSNIPLRPECTRQGPANVQGGAEDI